MTARAFLTLTAALVLTGTAAADTKVGVLGLEVAGAIDIQATTLARNLTNAIRTEAAKTPGYTIPATANKELLDEKVNASCDTEAPDCMAGIGRRLGVQQLIFGRITTRGKDASGGYQLTLKLLDVDSKKLSKEEALITLREASDGLEGKRAVEVYHQLTNTPMTGPSGPDLFGPAGPKKPSRPGGGWRIATYVSGTVAIGMFAGLVVSGVKVNSLTTKAEDMNLDCDLGDHDNPTCKDGRKFSKLSYVTGFGGIGLAIFAGFAGYKGFFGSNESGEHAMVGRKRKPSFAVTPIMSPDGAGATVRFDW